MADAHSASLSYMRDTRSQLKWILCEANDSEKKAYVIDQRSFPTLSNPLSKFFYIFGKTQFYGHAGASKHTTRNVYGRELIKHSGVTRFCVGFEKKKFFFVYLLKGVDSN